MGKNKNENQLNFYDDPVERINAAESRAGSFDEINLLRQELGEKILSFGVPFLDDAFEGILLDDLILLGAYSGAGKTELGIKIAQTNAAKGHTVSYFGLEAHMFEVEMRTLYKLSLNEFFKDQQRPKNVNLDYAKWKINKLPELEVYTIRAQEMFKESFKNLRTYYKEKSFDVDDMIINFNREVIAGSELIVFDHAHYFDWGEKSENEGLKKIVTHLRDLNLLNKIPVVLIGHLRKENYNQKLYAPSLEEFHGSSELYKRATKAITMGGGKYLKTGHAETFINAAKFRDRGQVTKFTGLTMFNVRENKYESEYSIGESEQKRDKDFELVKPEDLPSWCDPSRCRNYHESTGNETTDVFKRYREKLNGRLPFKD